MKIEIEITDTDMKVLLGNIVDLKDWVENLLHSKAQGLKDVIVKEKLSLDFDGVSDTEKEQIIQDAEIETAKEKQIKIDKEI